MVKRAEDWPPPPDPPVRKPGERYLARSWASFRELALAEVENPVQITEMCRAFYAGARSVQSAMERVGEPDISEDDGVAVFAGIHVELQAFLADVKAGARMTPESPFARLQERPTQTRPTMLAELWCEIRATLRGRAVASDGRGSLMVFSRPFDWSDADAPTIAARGTIARLADELDQATAPESALVCSLEALLAHVGGGLCEKCHPTGEGACARCEGSKLSLPGQCRDCAGGGLVKRYCDDCPDSHSCRCGSCAGSGRCAGCSGYGRGPCDCLGLLSFEPQKQVRILGEPFNGRLIRRALLIAEADLGGQERQARLVVTRNGPEDLRLRIYGVTLSALVMGLKSSPGEADQWPDFPPQVGESAA